MVSVRRSIRRSMRLPRKCVACGRPIRREPARRASVNNHRHAADQCGQLGNEATRIPVRFNGECRRPCDRGTDFDVAMPGRD